jgi:hypothetical protein
LPTGYSTGSGKSVTETLTAVFEETAFQFGRLLYQEGIKIMAESQPLVPVDTGTLRSTGYVSEPEREGDTITVDIGYGGPAAKINPKSGESSVGYGLYVHENLDAHHKVGQAKFLEQPFRAAANGMGQRIADGMNDVFAGNQDQGP